MWLVQLMDRILVLINLKYFQKPGLEQHSPRDLIRFRHFFAPEAFDGVFPQVIRDLPQNPAPVPWGGWGWGSELPLWGP